MKRPERIYLMPDFANLLAEQTDAQGFFRTYPFDGDIAYAPVNAARDKAVQGLVRAAMEAVLVMNIESKTIREAREPETFLCLQDALEDLAAIEEAESDE